MADVRRAGRTNRVDRTVAKKNGAARKPRTRTTRKPRPKIFATLEENDLKQLTNLYAMVEQKAIELAAMQNHYKLAIEEIREKYTIHQTLFNLDFATGKITEIIPEE